MMNSSSNYFYSVSCLLSKAGVNFVQVHVNQYMPMFEPHSREQNILFMLNQ